MPTFGESHMIVIGLTGSIGMGKTATAAMFREAGVPVFDADATVHALYRGEAAEAIAAAFPAATQDGLVDRERLRAAVLDEPTALPRLEAILHPLVRQARENFLAESAAAACPIVVLDIPLLFETGVDADVDRVVVVSAPEAVQKARVLARPGMTEARFSAILQAQMPDAEKRRRADVVIDTGSGLERARAQVRALLDELRRRGSDA